MSRKHYVRLAAAIAQLPTRATKAQVALTICEALRGTNPRYDSARFYRAATAKGKSK